MRRVGRSIVTPSRAAATRTSGRLPYRIDRTLSALLAELEGSLEFADEEDGPATGHDLDTILSAAIERIEALLELAPAGRRLREGVQVVLTGPVNAGKSSLFNALLAEDRAIAQQGGIDLLFLGDSITEMWPADAFEANFGRYDPANFGIGGDKTQNLLWRLRNGAVGQLDPKVVVLMIGVNNFGLGDDTPEDVFRGVEQRFAQVLALRLGGTARGAGGC